MKLYKKHDKEDEEKALLEYMGSTQEVLTNRKRKVLIISSIVLGIILIIKIFFGTIEIGNPFGYPSNNARYFKVTVNNKQIGVYYDMQHKTPIIPFLVNLNSYYSGSSRVEGYKETGHFYADESDSYFIRISNYSCYLNNVKIGCYGNSNSQEMRENTDTKYTHLVITKITRGYGIVYDGDFQRDITSFVKDKGQYHIEITAKHKRDESKVFFYFEN